MKKDGETKSSNFEHPSCHPLVLDAEVQHFSNGHQMIKLSIQRDQLNKENLKRMEKDLRELGDHRTANQLARTSIISICLFGSRFLHGFIPTALRSKQALKLLR